MSATPELSEHTTVCDPSQDANFFSLHIACTTRLFLIAEKVSADVSLLALAVVCSTETNTKGVVFVRHYSLAEPKFESGRRRGSLGVEAPLSVPF